MSEVKSFRPNGEEPIYCNICKEQTLLINHHRDMGLCENPKCPAYLRFRDFESLNKGGENIVQEDCLDL